MSIRLIVSDVDGTILPRDGALSERTRAAVQACAQAGIPFVICSGRWYVSARVIAEGLGQADGYMIVANGGAVVRMDGGIVREWLTPTAEARRAYGIMRKYNVMMNAFVRNAVYRVNTGALKRKKRGLDGYLGDVYRIVTDDWEAFESEGLVNPYKLEAYGEDPDALARLKAELLEAGFSVSSAYMDNMEIMAAGLGKGTAVEWLARRLGVRREECMAFGDNTNDRSMLEAVGWPVAVANAAEELKSCARLIAPDCAEDGVAQVIERALRGEIG